MARLPLILAGAALPLAGVAAGNDGVGDGQVDILSVSHGVYGSPHAIELFVNHAKR